MGTLIRNDEVLLRSGVTPTIGSNGNWFIDSVDTGKPALAKTTTATVVLATDGWEINEYGMYCQNIEVDGVSSNCFTQLQNIYDETDINLAKLQAESFNKITKVTTKNGSIMFECLYGEPEVDLTINVTYSVLTNQSNSNKGLEFKWDGTSLGVRQEGQQEYQYSDLSGPEGQRGIDGSSIIDAILDERGHLLVTMQDTDDSMPTDKILSFAEDGIVTEKMMTNITNSISRLNKEVLNLKSSFYRITLTKKINDEFSEIFSKYGSGNSQIVVSKFTGVIRITIDDIQYTGTFNQLDSQYETNLLSITDDTHRVRLSKIFDPEYTGSLDIRYSKNFKIEVRVFDNDQHLYPTFVVQGNHYNIMGTAGSSDGYVPNEEPISNDEIDEILGIFD